MFLLTFLIIIQHFTYSSNCVFCPSLRPLYGRATIRSLRIRRIGIPSVSMTSSRFPSSRAGFTLMELIIVIGIMAVLAVIVVTSVNPTKNLTDARNAQRESDVIVIMNAVHQYQLDTGDLPDTLPYLTMKQICRTGSKGLPCSGGVLLPMLEGTYFASMPVDPLVTSGTGTQYWITRNSGRRVTVIAAYAEGNKSIFITR